MSGKKNVMLEISAAIRRSDMLVIQCHSLTVEMYGKKNVMLGISAAIRRSDMLVDVVDKSAYLRL